jgi:hypothetical protein
MTKKQFLGGIAALALIGTTTSAYAVEINGDTGFDNASYWTTMGNWSVSGSKAVGANASAWANISKVSSAIKKGHTYQVSFTVSGRTAGSVQPYVGLSMMHTATGSYISYPASTISDNFTTASGITTGVTPSNSDDPVGAFRMFCGGGQVLPDDPLVYANQSGASHFHQFYGNTSVTAKTTTATLRATGGTTCGNGSDQNHPLNRSAYWFPAMMDGVGNVVRPDTINLYYKRDPASSSQCTLSNSLRTADSCVAMPTGMHFISGYNFSTGTGGPIDNAAMHWECWDWSSGSVVIYGPYSHLSDVQPGGSGHLCPVDSVIVMNAAMANCWDGVYLDTPDHRAHVVYGTGPIQSGQFFRSCVGSGSVPGHPVEISNIEVQLYFRVDQAFQNKTWHWSSDEMVAGAEKGSTFHFDYMNGWSPTVQSTWEASCIDAHKSCGGGNLGDGTEIKRGDETAPTGVGNPGAPDSNPRHPARYLPTAKLGLGKPCSTNTTCTYELTATGETGEFGLMSWDGFTGNVDNFSVQEITSGHKGPVTIHN